MKHSNWRAAAAPMTLAAIAVLSAAPACADESVTLRRLADGTPHIQAADMRGAGLGVGYAQAEDALCTLADAYLTFAGGRSLAFGPQGKPDYNATYTGGTNLELDVFFRAFLDEPALARFKAAQLTELKEMAEGFAVGYNRYLAEARARPAAAGEPACLRKEWVRPITADDVFRRIQAPALAGGYARFIPEIVRAAPPGPKRSAQAAEPLAPIADAWHVGGVAGLGSNVLAFGAGEGNARAPVLFGNPHWFWGGPDRFYQMHLTVDGKLDVAGVGFVGVPLPMIGYTDKVAWSHTVSAARRFGLFALQLDPADPLRYLVDGQARPIRAQVIEVPVRSADGKTSTVRRTVYRSEYGPIVDLSARAQPLGWTAKGAVALRDINETNDRIFSTYLAWAQARSLDDFVAITRRELAMPWVNTAAIGRDDPRAWYGDVGAVPNAPDALRRLCATPFTPMVAQWDRAIPMLDGSRSACNWTVDASTPIPGQMPADRLPARFRTDYVANMNDSYWLASPAQPLEGYDAVLGGERQRLSLRARHGHAIAREALAQAGGDTPRLIAFLERETLASRDYAAQTFKPALLHAACGQPDASVKQACGVLNRWAGSAGADDRGAWLWSAFWQAMQDSPAAKSGKLYGKPFDPARPLDTPNAIRPLPAQARAALMAATTRLASQGVALDASVGERLRVNAAAGPIALYGGCGSGYFTIACPAVPGGVMDGRAHANTYLQLVSFGKDGVQARTLLASGERETAWRGGLGAEPIRRYAEKQWQRAPWTPEELKAAQVSVRTLAP
ncbi:penicillin acylase family protein [Pseudomonadota bacterium AL_CKDN230030165-1A_HGKHYDSX7]